jgi:hypothetical protein
MTDWVTTSTDMRRNKHRRKGEINGPFSWGSVLDFFAWAVILAALFYVCFLGGRFYESAKKDTVHPSIYAKDLKSFRIGGH